MLKYKIRIPTKSGVTDTHIDIPVVMENQMVDQSEIIDREFVDIEVENSINPILDFEKIRFRPFNTTTPSEIIDLTYNLHFLNTSGTYNSSSYYGDVGFVDTDLSNRKNNFAKSFLRLSFHDTDILSRQRLISFITIFSTIYDSEITSDSKTIAANNKETKFIVFNPELNTNGPSEGFNIFHFKDEVTSAIPKELFMRAEFNNAKDGTTTNFMTSATNVTIDNLVNQLHTKYVLKRDASIGYYYEIDSTFSNNISGTEALTIDLYEINSL